MFRGREHRLPPARPLLESAAVRGTRPLLLLLMRNLPLYKFRGSPVRAVDGMRNVIVHAGADHDHDRVP